MKFSIEVAYPANWYFDKDFDAVLSKVARGERMGSGMGMGFRDISYHFPTEKRARNAAARIKKIDRRIKIYLQHLVEFEGDYEWEELPE